MANFVIVDPVYDANIYKLIGYLLIRYSAGESLINDID